MKEAIAKALYYQYCRGRGWENDKWEIEPECVHDIYLEEVDKLFALREDGLRLVIVREKGKLPKDILCDCTHPKTAHYNGEGCCDACGCTWYYPNIGWINAIKDGYVQEVKE